jgi:hypothetical protein
MKIIILLFVSIFYLNAESMYQGKCVSDITGLNTTSFRIYFSNGSNVTSTNQTILSQIMDNFNKFTYDPVSKYCHMIQGNNSLGLDTFQFNFLMALTGLLTSILLVFIIFLKV